MILLVAFFLAACGGAESGGDQASEAGASESQGAGLSQHELEKGIGPIDNVELGLIDEALAARGEQSFTTKCATCHKMDERYVGPPLGEVLDRRTPEFVMNMMLNPDEMVKKHPEAKAMLAQYLTPMPSQNLTEEEARAILEYLRQQDAAGSQTAP